MILNIDIYTENDFQGTEIIRLTVPIGSVIFLP